jgi:hypothetical protein
MDSDRERERLQRARRPISPYLVRARVRALLSPMLGLVLGDRGAPLSQFTVSLAVLVTPPAEALIEEVPVIPENVETWNVCVVKPAGTTIEPGTDASKGFVLLSLTFRPPPGAGTFSVTVPVEGLPLVTVVGLKGHCVPRTAISGSLCRLQGLAADHTGGVRCDGHSGGTDPVHPRICPPPSPLATRLARSQRALRALRMRKGRLCVFCPRTQSPWSAPCGEEGVGWPRAVLRGLGVKGGAGRRASGR